MKKLLISLLFILVSLSCFSQMTMSARHFTARLDTASGGTPSTQNLLLQSEATNITPWQIFNAWVLVTADAGTDTFGSTTMEYWTTGFTAGSLYQEVTLADNTLYTFAFDIYLAVGSTFTTFNVQIEDAGDESIVYTNNISTSLTESVQRLSYEFTTENPMAGDARIVFYLSGSSGSEDVYIGACQVYTGSIGSYSYATTTTTQDNP